MPLLTGISILALLLALIGGVFAGGMMKAQYDTREHSAYEQCPSRVVIRTTHNYLCLKKDAVHAVFER